MDWLGIGNILIIWIDWKILMDRFWTACLAFSFICGMFVAHIIEMGHGCTITVERGREAHVYIGRAE